MEITIEGDAKEIAALLAQERLIDSKIEEKLEEKARKFVKKFEEVSGHQAELFQELLKERLSAESVPDSY